MKFPILQTERLILREWHASDAPDLFEIFRHESVLQYTALPTYQKVQDALRTIESYNEFLHKKQMGIAWAVQERVSGRALGVIDLTYKDKRNFRADLGCSFTPDASGMGFGFEAMKEVMRFVFEEFSLFKMNRLQAETDPRNTAAKKLLEKLGFKDEAFLRQYCFERGKFVDQHIYGFLREDWEKRNADQSS